MVQGVSLGCRWWVGARVRVCTGGSGSSSMMCRLIIAQVNINT